MPEPLGHPAPPAREPDLTSYLSPMCSRCSAETPCLMVAGGTDRSRDVLATGPGYWYRADEVDAALRREREENERVRVERDAANAQAAENCRIANDNLAEMECIQEDLFAAVADRDRYRAGLEDIAGRECRCDGWSGPCGCFSAVVNTAHVALAPPTPAAQGH